MTPARIRHPVVAAAFACALGLGALMAAPMVHAQQAALAGIMGSKALLVIDGRAPRGMAAGQEAGGVKVISVGPESVVLEIAGTRREMRLGDTPVSVSGRPGGSGYARLVLRADRNGHFVNSGFINGKTMQYMVDTGATVVTLGASDARRLGLDLQNGEPVMVSTVNGNAKGWRLVLDSVRVGDIELRDVNAVVVPESMPYILLGNSFLNGFRMSRTNDEMVLEKSR